MCKDFSCLITQSRQVLWERGVSSHDHLEELFKKYYPELKSHKRYVKAEITPDKRYLYPEGDWTFKVDEESTPDWFTDEHKIAAMREFRKWKKEVYALINLKEARNPINPLLGKAKKSTKKDIELLKQWASVGDSVWASVGAYCGSLFDIWGANYQYQPAVDLWKRGFVASYDGKTWRLHSGKDVKIVYEMQVP